MLITRESVHLRHSFFHRRIAPFIENDGDHPPNRCGVTGEHQHVARERCLWKWRDSISGTAGPNESRFGTQLGITHLPITHVPILRCRCTCARAHPFFVSQKLLVRFRSNFVYRQQPNNHCWFTPQARGAAARAHVHTPCSYRGN